MNALLMPISSATQPAQPSRSGAASPSNPLARRGTRSRSNTANSLTDRFSRIMEEPPLDPPPKINSRIPSGQNSPRREMPGFDFSSGARPIPSRTQSGFEGPTSLGNGTSTPPDMRPLSRVPTDSSQISNMRLNLRATKSKDSGYGANVFEDANSEESDGNGNGFSGLEQRRAPSFSAGQDWASGKKAPPPPPPSRAKKPPPPPPMKRSALSTSEVPHY